MNTKNRELRDQHLKSIKKWEEKYSLESHGSRYEQFKEDLLDVWAESIPYAYQENLERDDRDCRAIALDHIAKDDQGDTAREIFRLEDAQRSGYFPPSYAILLAFLKYHKDWASQNQTFYRNGEYVDPLGKLMAWKYTTGKPFKSYGG